MTRTGFIGCVVVCLVLEALVVASILNTRSRITQGGDVFHNEVDGLPLNVGGQDRPLPRGTYVVTATGPVRLPFYWVYKYALILLVLPIVMVSGSFWIYRRRAQTAS